MLAALGIAGLASQAHAFLPSGTATAPVFSSDFGTGVTLGAVYPGFPGRYFWKDLSGASSTPGYASPWPMSAWGMLANGNQSVGVNLLSDATVSTQLQLDGFCKTSLDMVTGPSGTTVQALHTQQNAQNGATQVPLTFQVESSFGNAAIPDEGSCVMITKLPANLAAANLISGGGQNWFAHWELKTGDATHVDDDMRIALFVIKENDGHLGWQVGGNQGANSWGAFVQYWQFSDVVTPVPVGQWMTLEVYWKRTGSHLVNGGRVVVKLNGSILFDANSLSISGSTTGGPNAGNNTGATTNSSMMGVGDLRIQRLFAPQNYSAGNYPLDVYCAGLTWNLGLV